MERLQLKKSVIFRWHVLGKSQRASGRSHWITLFATIFYMDNFSLLVRGTDGASDSLAASSIIITSILP